MTLTKLREAIEREASREKCQCGTCSAFRNYARELRELLPPDDATLREDLRALLERIRLDAIPRDDLTDYEAELIACFRDICRKHGITEEHE